MKKYTILIIILLLLFCLASCKDEPELEQFEVTMHCVQIDSDGKILRELTISVSAEETEAHQYGAKIVFSGTEDPPFSAEIPDSYTLNCYDLNPDRYDFMGIGYSADLNRYTGVELTIDRDRTMLQMFVGDDAEEIYVGSTDQDFDPTAVLEYFSAVHP